jgi:hypothetical protein
MGESRIDPEAGEEGLGGMLVFPPRNLDEHHADHWMTVAVSD